MVTRLHYTNQEFWKDKELVNDYNKISLACDQSLGKSALARKQAVSFDGKKQVLILSQEEQFQLLRREKQLKENYQRDVIQNQQSAKEFWNRFIENQKIHKTVLVGGINPIYIEGKEEEDKSKIDIALEVDLLKNFDTKDENFEKFEQEQLEYNKLAAKADNSSFNQTEILLQKNEKVKNIIESFNQRSITVLEDDFNQRKLAQHQQLDYNDGIMVQQIIKQSDLEYPCQMEIECYFNISLDEQKKIKDNWIREKTRFLHEIQDLQQKNSQLKQDILNNKEREHSITEILKEMSKKKDKWEVLDQHSSTTEYKEFERVLMNFNKQTNQLLKFLYQQNQKKDQFKINEILKLLTNLTDEIEAFKKQQSVEMKKYFNSLEQIKFRIISNINSIKLCKNFK